tara:strand:- start:73144 stop:75945 length:2802 start_codon:yes stop_codon:yes gene_type:complete
MSKLEFNISAFPTRVDNIDDKLHVTYSDGSTINKGLIPGYADKEVVNPYIDDKGYLKWFYPDETEHGNFLVRVDTEVKIEIAPVNTFGLYEGMSRTDLSDTYRTMKQGNVLLEDTYTPLVLSRYHPDITSGTREYVDGNGNKLTCSEPSTNASYGMYNLADFTTNQRHYFSQGLANAYYQWEFKDTAYLTGAVACLWYSETSPWKFEYSTDGINWTLIEEKPLPYDGNRAGDPLFIQGKLTDDIMGCGYYHHFPKPITCKFLRLTAPFAGRSNVWRGIQIFVPITNLRNIAVSMEYSNVYFDIDSFSTLESADQIFLSENLKERDSNAENAITTESRMVLEVTDDRVSKYMEPIVFDKRVTNTIQGASDLFGGLILPEGNYFARLTGVPSIDNTSPAIMHKGDDAFSNHYGVPCCFFDETTGLPLSEVKIKSASNKVLGLEAIKQIVGYPDRNTYRTLFSDRAVGNTYFLGNNELIIELDYHRNISTIQFLSGYAYYQNTLEVEVYVSDLGVDWTLIGTCNYNVASRHNLSDQQKVNARTKWLKIVPKNTADTRFGLSKIFIGTDETATATEETTFNFEVLSERTVTFRNIHKSSFNWKGCKLELYRTEFTNKAAAYQTDVNGSTTVLIEVNDSESAQKLNDGSDINFNRIHVNNIFDRDDYTLEGPDHWNWNGRTLPIENLKVTGRISGTHPWNMYGLQNVEAGEIITEYPEPITFTHFIERIGDSDYSSSDVDYDYRVVITGNYFYFKAPTRIEIEGFNESTQQWEKIKSIGAGQKAHYNNNDSETLSDITEDVDGVRRVADMKTRAFDLGGSYTYKKIKYICHSDGQGASMGIDIMGVGALGENPPVKFRAPNSFQLWKMAKVNPDINAKLIIRKIESDGTIVDMSDKEIYVDKHETVDFIQMTETLPPGNYEITSKGYLDDSGWYIKGV